MSAALTLLDTRRIMDALGIRLERAAGRFALARCGLQVGRRVEVLGRPIVAKAPGSCIEIADDVVLCSSSRWTALGVHHPVVLRTLRPGAVLIVGAGTGISGGSFCAAARVTIGERCLIGANVIVCDTDFHALRPQGRRHNADWSQIGVQPVHIGNDVFIGTGAMVLKGVEVGDGAVIGAGSVVTRSVPARSIAAGNPARVIGTVPE